MILERIQEDQNWVYTTWTVAFALPWQNMMFGIYKMMNTFSVPEIRAGSPNEPAVQIHPMDARLDEKEMVVLRGYNEIFKAKASLCMKTHDSKVTLTTSKNMNIPLDYESVNKALGPFMTALELAIYVGGKQG